MTLNIIIPNYNGCHFLSTCLNSIYNQTFTDFEVTLVDNGSSDESLALVKKQYPNVHVITLSTNKGFAEAANIGIRSTHSPYVMLLNNDTILDPCCIQNMMHSIRQSNRIFSVGATILTMAPPHNIDTIGDYYSLFGYAFCHSQGLPPMKRQTKSVFSNCGCAVIYRTTLFKQTGLFDPCFFAYLEDVDLGIRAQLSGLKNIHCPNALVYHFGSGTTTTRQKYSAFKIYYSARNNVLLRCKNLSFLQRLLHSPFVFAGTILKYIYFYKLQLHHEYRKGVFDGLKLSRSVSPNPHISFFSRLKVELWIWYGTVLYIIQYLKRKLS